MNTLAVMAKTIEQHFSINELNSAIFATGVNYEDIRGETIDARARETVGHFRRITSIDDLAKALGEAKPTADFSAWGGPPPKESLHNVLYKLLAESFSAEQINTLAFAVYPSLYDEVGANQSPEEKIGIILKSVKTPEHVLALTAWVKTNNPGQYSAYFDRINKAFAVYQNRLEESKHANPSANSPVSDPLQKKSTLNDAAVLALKMYANGYSDDGKLAREALTVAGIQL